MENKTTIEIPLDSKQHQADQNNTKDDEQDYPTKFGYFKYRPDYLQFFNSPRWLLALLCGYGVVINMVIVGFRGVVVPQIEKRFNMTSASIGSIMSSMDISSGISGVLLTYYVGQRHKSKWIGYGMITLSIGSFIFMLPHFIAGKYDYRDLGINNTSQSNPLCGLNSSNILSDPNFCNNEVKQSTPWIYPLIFTIGLILYGIGYSIHYNVGLAYIDESISPTISPVYIAVFHMITTIGSMLGFIVGGIFSNIYIDWPAISKDLEPNDPRWIGAWWLGYLVVGCIILATSALIFAYPYHLPSYKKYKMKRLAQSKSVNKALVDNLYGKRWADFPRAFLEIASNRIFMLAAAGLSIDQISITGLTTFLPKFIQSQSGASLLTSTIVVGAIATASIAIAQFGSGIIMKRWNLVGSKISRFCFYVCVINAASAFVLLLSCDNPKIAGLFVPYPSSFNGTSPSQTELSMLPSVTCNAMCHCDNFTFNPVCGGKGISYQSPCHAGCNSITTTDNTAVLNYSKCSCVDSATERLASSGLCPTESCLLIYPLLAGAMIMVVCTFIVLAPTLIVILRSIPESQTTFGMGVEGLGFRLIGGLFGQVIFGYVMDASCILWSEECGRRQFCWRYDNRKLSLYIFTATVTCKVAKLVIYGFLWYFHRKQEMTVKELTPDQTDKPSITVDDVEMKMKKEEN